MKKLPRKRIQGIMFPEKLRYGVSKIQNFSFLLSIFYFLFSIIYYLSPSPVRAQTQTPQDKGFTPLKYDCGDTTDSLGWDKLDFHPLRPYPGSPCDPLIPKSKPEHQPISFACGKSITAVDKEKFDPYEPGTNCKADGAEIVCARDQDFDVTLSLSGAKIPILGNSENLDLTDAQKMNEYLSWYLSGSVQNWTEDKLLPFVRSDMDRLINFSGPLRKLLPFDYQQFELRRKLITNKDGVGENYHDYLVGCQAGIGSYIDRVKARFEKVVGSDDPLLQKIVTTLTNLPKILTFDQAVACRALFDKKYRLSDFKDGVLGSRVLASLPPDPQDYDDFSRFWKDYISWSGKILVPLLGPVDIPLLYSPFGFFWPDLWAQLFQNVPFSTLEDTTSEITISVFDDPRGSKQDKDVITQDKPWGVSSAKLDADRLGLTYETYKPGDTAYFKDKDHLLDLKITKADSRIYIPHVRAIRALTDLLQSTFSPHPDGFDRSLVTGEVKDHQGPSTDGIPTVNEKDNNSSVRPDKPAPEALWGHRPDLDGFDYDGRCDLTDVRWNPGDSLLGNQITANLKYTQVFRYKPKVPVGTLSDGTLGCTSGSQCKSGKCEPLPNGTKRCTPTPPVELPTKGFAATFVKLPFGKEIAEKIVFGPQSIFKRFMFKLDPYKIELKDLPAVSSVNLSAHNNKEGKSAEVVAGYGGGKGEIYWRSLGGVYDYFLGASSAEHNLQRLLRPKEFSLTSSFGTTPISPGTTSFGTRTNLQCSTLDYEIPYRQTSASPGTLDEIIARLKQRNPGGFSQSVIERATTNLKSRYAEIVNKSRLKGFNPAFVIAIWLEETAASALSGLDFGCGAAPSNNFEAQLNCFLGLYDDWGAAGRYDSSAKSCREGGANPNFEDFMLYYSTGFCDAIQRQNRQFCNIHSDFPQRVQDFYSLVVGP